MKLNEKLQNKDVQTILDLNWVNQSKQVTVEDGYMYIIFIGWASSCLLFQYANGTALSRKIMGSNTYTQSKTDNTYTFTIDNTGLMYGFKIKI